MARQLKPYEVGEVTDHQSRITTTIYLDRNATPKVFYGTVMGERVQAESESAVKTAILNKCREVTTYGWQKIIVVRTTGDRYGDRGISLSFSQHEIAKRPPGMSRHYPYAERRCYEMPSGHEETISDYSGPTESSPGNGEFVLPYSEVVLEGLKDLAGRLELLRERLHELLGADDAVRRLADVVGLLLPAADAEEEE